VVMGNILSDCGAAGIINSEDGLGGDTRIILRVDHALIHDTLGANVSGFKVGDQIVVASLNKAKALDALGWRYRDQVRAAWPQSYRFQVPRAHLVADVVSRDHKVTRCVVQVPLVPNERTMENARLHVEDAEIATGHATSFNRYMADKFGGNMMDQRQQGEAPPSVKVCAPVACEVLSTNAPEVLPRGAACTVTPYPFPEVMKFVFDGADEFLDVPQAYFHFAAFATGGADMVCDIQGWEDDYGGMHLIDPVVLGGNKPAVSQYLSTLAAGEQAAPPRPSGPDHAPSDQRFDRLHPRCGEICRSFDPTRHGAKGKKGYCGITCMT